MRRKIKVAVCGELPTACDFLLKHGVVQIDQFLDATEIRREREYHLILIHAPRAEGLLNTHYAGKWYAAAADPDPASGRTLLQIRIDRTEIHDPQDRRMLKRK